MTIGIILAAGIGSRLRPMTNRKPKCLITSANKTILQYQLDSYAAAGVEKIYIVVGYESNAIREYCKHIKNLDISIIENEIYEDSNNMYSLYLTKEFASGRSFILNNADLTIAPELVSSMLEDARADLIAVDVDLYNQESMKISVNDDGFVTDISKSIDKNSSLGCSIDFYKFSAESSKILFDEMMEIIDVEENLKDWTEVVMQRLFISGRMKFHAIDISGMPWVEIDDYSDLALSDRIFSQMDRAVTDYRHFMLDLDGTVFVGESEIDGAVDAISRLKRSGKRVSYLSNNSSKSKAKYVAHLSTFGLDVEESDIILSTDAAIDFLKSNAVARVFVLGTSSLESIVEESGIRICSDDPEYVLVGYDTELTYRKLANACRLINKNIDYIVTHCDLVCPTKDGPVPDAGLLTAMLEQTTERPPYKIFGKPNTQMVDICCKQQGTDKTDVLVVGDRLYTDIKMAADAGVDSLLVLSGDTSREDIEDSIVRPTYVLNSLADIV